MNRILVRVLRPVAVAALVAAGLSFVSGDAIATIDSAQGKRGPDFTPPTTPGRLRFAPGPTGMTTIAWDRSTDNRRVTGYQVFLNAGQLATVTGTSFQTFTPPPSAHTFRVRAVDAAGNLSPFVILASGFPLDTLAPSTPTGLRPGTAGGRLQLDWTASTDNVAVAGYEVNVNGVPVLTSATHAVGGTFQIPGTYQFQVRAFDGAGNFSPYAQTSLSADPVPPLPTPTAGQPS